MKYVELTRWRQDDREEMRSVIVQARAIVVLEPQQVSRLQTKDGDKKWVNNSPRTKIFLDVGDLTYDVDETPEQIWSLIETAKDIV